MTARPPFTPTPGSTPPIPADAMFGRSRVAPSDEPSRARAAARYAALALLAVYGLLRLAKAEWWDLLDDLNLAVHEAGHVVFSPFGETVTILGGSLFQLIVPAAFVAYFFRTLQPYAGAVTLAWVAQSMVNVSRYIGDARAQELPLLGGEGTIHDWEFLLATWNLLRHDLVIARGVHFAAALTFIVAIAVGAATAGRGSASRTH